MTAIKNFVFGWWAKLWVRLDEMSAAVFVKNALEFFALCAFGLAAVAIVTALLLLL